MKKFVIADLHLGHDNACKFLRADGVTKLRPWDSADDMNTEIIERWNAKVAPKDKVYVLGDVVMSKRFLIHVALLNGDKILVKGNHDNFSLDAYTPLFSNILGSIEMGKVILTHVPVHPGCLTRWRGNIHGHTHAENVMLNGHPDPRYLCVSVEQTNYEPILLEEALASLDSQLENSQFAGREKVL